MKWYPTKHPEALTGLTPEQLDFIDQVYALAEKNYENGADVVIETMSPRDVVKEFKTLDDMKDFCGLWCEQNLNARCGNDDDPQLEMMRRHEEEWDDL
jgi:hypothetical protein